MLGKQSRQRSVGKVHPQQLTPEVDGRADGSGRELVDVFEDEVLGLVLAASRLQLRFMGVEQRGQVFRFHQLDRAVGQSGEQLCQAEPRYAAVVHDVPRQNVLIGATQVQHQRRCRSCFATVPCASIPLFKLGTEGERVLVQHHLEATAAQLGEQLLVEQNVIRVARHPKPGQVGGEVAKYSVRPLAHDGCPPGNTSPETRTNITAFKSGTLASASSRDAIRASCSCCRRLRR